jgi:hypothetical protein
MPIREAALKDPKNNHIAIKGTATWAMAAAALKQKNGAATWPLVVLKTDGTYGAETFEQIVKKDVAAEAAVETIPGLCPVKAVEADLMSTGDAETLANAEKCIKLLVVVEKGKFKGVLFAGSHRGGDLPTSKLNELAGSNVDLSKLGDLLLD